MAPVEARARAPSGGEGRIRGAWTAWRKGRRPSHGAVRGMSCARPGMRWDRRFAPTCTPAERARARPAHRVHGRRADTSGPDWAGVIARCDRRRRAMHTPPRPMGAPALALGPRRAATNGMTALLEYAF